MSGAGPAHGVAAVVMNMARYRVELHELDPAERVTFWACLEVDAKRERELAQLAFDNRRSPPSG